MMMMMMLVTMTMMVMMMLMTMVVVLVSITWEADFTASCVLHHGVPSSKDHRRRTLNGRRGRNESVSATGRNSFCAEKKIPSRPKLWNKDKVSGGKWGISSAEVFAGEKDHHKLGALVLQTVGGWSKFVVGQNIVRIRMIKLFPQKAPPNQTGSFLNNV